MRIIMERTDIELCQRISRIVAKQLIEKPSSIIGFDATLKTKFVHETLIDTSNAIGLDWSEAKAVGLYEFVDADENNKASVLHRLQFQLLNHVNINKDNIFIPDSTAVTASFNCDNFITALKSFDGMDLVLLELAPDGSVAFNTAERSIDKIAYKREVEASDYASKAVFEGDAISSEIITIGMKYLMNTKQIVLMARGKETAKAVRTMLLGEVNPINPASILQLHPNLLVIVDEDAASMMW